MSQVAATPILPQQQIIPLDLEGCTDLLEAAVSKKTLDLGCTVVHMIEHAILGRIVLINTAGEAHAAVRM